MGDVDRPPTTALITGAASGIGRALAEKLARAGRQVVVADVDASGLDDLADVLTGEGREVVPMTVDVTDAEAVQRAVDETVARFGRLDHLFNNAGVGGTLPFLEATMEHWQRIVGLNLMGVIHGVQAAYPVMVRQGSGHIVNTASVSGLIPVPGQTLYNTTKYAVVGLSHTLRPEAARFGVRVTVVCPGPVQSAIWGTPILGARVRAGSPGTAIAADDAADRIWRGVEANRATIVFPRRDRRATLLYRLHPSLVAPAFRRHLRRLG